MGSKKALWTPSLEFASQSNLQRYLDWLKSRGKPFSDFRELWNWSVSNDDDFWTSLFEYFDIQYSGKLQPVRTSDVMPDVKWFERVTLSYAEHVFLRENNSYSAIVYASENSPALELTWSDLRAGVASVSTFLREAGVTSGDRVAAFLPCIPEATIGFLAVNSIGAVWSSCSPDFGVQAVLDRFAQIEPKVLIACSGYSYGGKYFDKRDVIQQLGKSLPTVEKIIIVGDDISDKSDGSISWKEVLKRKGELTFMRTPFNHPIWVVFSSGTTGLPKPITHSVGGILLEHLKYLTFHNDLKPGERLFWFTTTGWMMWNYIQSTLLCGATMVIYDGSPAFPDLGRLWRFCDEAGIHHFGTSAGFILACKKENVSPSTVASFKLLRSIGSTGSTLPPEGFEWVYGNVKNNVWLASMSGGTDVATAFVGGNPMWPVYNGEIQCRALGCSLYAWNDDGQPVVSEVGEMVITKPMPSMPIFFWNDPDKARYKESYFETFPGVWRHGDWTEITERDGVIIYGRSDATLNRGGVRIGTSEIYRAVDKISEVKDSLMVCIEKGNGEFYMPLFVMMSSGQELSADITKRINQAIRADNTPRHVPDEIIAVPDIPYTISGKKTETPVKKILMGKDPKKVINPGALRNPESLDFFAAFRKKITP
jgi:acetoacetyl-CoA synthetase